MCLENNCYIIYSFNKVEERKSKFSFLPQYKLGSLVQTMIVCMELTMDSVGFAWPELYSEHHFDMYNFDGGAEVTAEQ